MCAVQDAATIKSKLHDLLVLCSSQRVGAFKYGVRPRYVRPLEKPKTELQRLMLKAGAVATANVLSSRFSSEGKLDRGRVSQWGKSVITRIILCMRKRWDPC